MAHWVLPMVPRNWMLLIFQELTILFSTYSSVHTLQYILFSTPEGVPEGVPVGVRDFIKNLSYFILFRIELG